MQSSLWIFSQHILSSYKSTSSPVYKFDELESTFIGIVIPKKPDIVFGVVCRHSGMDLDELNNKYAKKLLDNLSKENKTIFFLGDFNTDLIKYDSHTAANEFLGSLSSIMILPYILHPRVKVHSKTVIVNIFFNHFLTKWGYMWNFNICYIWSSPPVSDHDINFFRPFFI